MGQKDHSYIQQCTSQGLYDLVCITLSSWCAFLVSLEVWTSKRRLKNLYCASPPGDMTSIHSLGDSEASRWLSGFQNTRQTSGRLEGEGAHMKTSCTWEALSWIDR